MQKNKGGTNFFKVIYKISTDKMIKLSFFISTLVIKSLITCVWQLPSLIAYSAGQKSLQNLSIESLNIQIKSVFKHKYEVYVRGFLKN